MEGDEAVFYMLNDKGDLDGMVLTCVDGFDLAGRTCFVEIDEAAKASEYLTHHQYSHSTVILPW